MLRYLTLSFIWLCTCCTSAQAAISTTELPSEFNITQRWFSWTNTFDIKVADAPVGLVKRRFFALLPQYDLYDLDEQHLSTARKRWFSFGAAFDIEDAAGNQLGSIEQKVFSFFPTFRVFAPNGDLLADVKFNFWGTKYTFSKLGEGEIATLTRPFFRLRSNWTFKILEPAYFAEREIHPLLVLTIAAFQVDREAWRRQSQQQTTTHTRQLQVQAGKQAGDADDVATKAFARELNVLHNQLATLQPQFSQQELSEEAYTTAANLVDASLLPSDVGNEGQGFAAAAIALLSSPSLTDDQKSALFQLLDQRTDELLSELTPAQ